MPYDEVDADFERYCEGLEAEERCQVAEAYEFANFFDFYLFSDTPQMNDAVQGLYRELRGTRAARKGHERGIKAALKGVLANLYRNFSIDPECYTIYPRNHAGYPKTRYNPFGIKWRGMERVVDGLEELDYTTNARGFYLREFEYGRRSRMRAEPHFIELLSHRYGLTADQIEQYEDREVIILRDENNRDQDYRDTPTIREMRAQVEACNALLDRHRIAVGLTTEEIAELSSKPVNLAAKKVHRVFNRGSFELGGRFYGPWWQLANEDIRRHILIDEEPTIECDYSAQHIHILYGLRGLNYFDIHGEGDDPYSLVGMADVDRDFSKVASLIAINAGTRNGALAAIRQRIRKEPAYSDIDPTAVLQGFEEKHRAIAGYFYSDAGLMLQFKDSLVSQYVINRFLEQDIVILDIHDSYITQRRHADLLKQTMVQAFRHLGLISIPPVTDNLPD